MLILSRKRNEQIVIADDIVITVVAIRGGTVRLGFEAPPEVSVHRREIYEAIREGRIRPETVREESDRSGASIGPSDKLDR